MEHFSFCRLAKDDALVASLLTLSDVMGTGRRSDQSQKEEEASPKLTHTINHH